MKTLLLGLGAALLFLSSLAGHTQMPAEPPQPAAPRPLEIPEPTKFTLPNGLNATLIDFGAVPKTTVAVVIRAGSLDEGERTWLSDLTAELMKQGTRHKNADELAQAAAEMGGELRIGVGADQTTLSLDVLSEYAPQALALLAEVVTQPLFPQTELPRVRQNFLRNLSVQLATPQAQADAAFSALLFPQHPYGRLFPTAEQLKTYSIDDVREFYSKNFGAQRARVYVVGKFDRAAVDAAIRRELGDWDAGPRASDVPPPPPARPVTRLIDRPDAPQSTLRIGLRVIGPSDPQFMPLSVTNTLLGGAFTSRITMNLRERKGWAYSPSSSLEAYFHQTVWVQQADVQTASTGPAIEEIYGEIARLAAQPPSSEELAAIKNYRNGIFVISNASRAGLVRQFAFMDLHGLPLEWLTSFVDRLYAVTPEQVSQAAREHLPPDRMSVVIVGNLSSVRPQLEKLEHLPDIER